MHVRYINSGSTNMSLTNFGLTRVWFNDMLTNPVVLQLLTMGLRDDLWFAVSEAFACFEASSCPFGPLYVAIWNDNMIRLTFNTITQTSSIPTTVFHATFRTTYGVRQVESAAFDASTTTDNLKALLLALPPQSAKVSVTKVQSASGYTVTVTYHLVLALGPKSTVQTSNKCDQLCSIKCPCCPA